MLHYINTIALCYLLEFHYVQLPELLCYINGITWHDMTSEEFHCVNENMLYHINGIPLCYTNKIMLH